MKDSWRGEKACSSCSNGTSGLHMFSGLCLTRAQLQWVRAFCRHVDYINLCAVLHLSAGPSPHGTNCWWATDRYGEYCKGLVRVLTDKKNIGMLVAVVWMSQASSDHLSFGIYFLSSFMSSLLHWTHLSLLCRSSFSYFCDGPLILQPV